MQIENLGKILVGAGFIIVLGSGYLAPRYMMYSLVPVIIGMLMIMYSRMK